MIGGLLITHGPLAQALIKAAEEIFGKTTHLYGFSVTNMSINEVVDRISEIISEEDWPDETIILVSLMGGSCWNAGITVKQKHSKCAVISGVNLNMLLSFLTKRDTTNLSELATMVMQDGVRGIAKN